MTPPTPKSTAVATVDRTKVLAPSFNGDQVELVKRTIAKGASDDELTLFLGLAQKYDLDPFAREIWYAHFEGEAKPATIMVGRDGLLAIAERTGQFDGMVSGSVKAGDTFEFGLMEPTHVFGQTHTVLKDGEETSVKGRGILVGGYAYVYRKDRRLPFRVYVEWDEHGKPKTRDAQGRLFTDGRAKTPWMKFPSLMIKKVAEANALRLAFRTSGLVAVEGEGGKDDELGDVIDGEAVEDPQPDVVDAPVDPDAEIPVFPDGDDDDQGRLT